MNNAKPEARDAAKLTHDPVLDLCVVVSKLVRYQAVEKGDYERLNTSFRAVLDEIPRDRRRAFMGAIGKPILQELLSELLQRGE